MSTTNECTERASLRSSCLSFTEVLGQSISNIAPSATPAFTIPAVFILAGNGTWLAFLFATIAVLLVGLHISYFSRRSASPGALYTNISEGAGPATGFVAGSGLVLAYMLTGAAVLPCFANFTNVVLGAIGVPAIPNIIFCAVGIIAAFFVVYKDVQISAKLMLTCEAVSLLMIIVLGVIVFIKSDFTFYGSLLTLKGVSMDSIRLGLVLAFFSFVGFESASALGHEAKNPFKSIPRAILISGVFVGIVFTIFSLIEIVGFMTAGHDLSQTTAPLNDLADINGVGVLGILISVGALISFWSCSVACITAGARIIHSMSNQKLIPEKLGKVHDKNETPHVATAILASLMFVIPAILLLFKIEPMMIFSYLGTIATLGFLFTYILVVVAAPIYLKRRGELKPGHIILAILTFVILLVPLVGSVYPLPPAPFNIFPFIFLAWLILSALYYIVANKRRGNLKVLSDAITAE